MYYIFLRTTLVFNGEKWEIFNDLDKVTFGKVMSREKRLIQRQMF